MKPDRDISILTHIVDYCDQIKATIERFGEDRTILHRMLFTGMLRRSVSCKLVS